MTSPAAPDVGSSVPPAAGFVRALPWCVGVCAVATLMPIVILPAALVAHLPTFFALQWLAIDLARRGRSGERVSPVSVATLVGGLGASVALMGFMAIGVLQDGTAAIFYYFTWMLLPILALVGSGLAAMLAGLCRLVLPWVSKT